MVACQAAAIRAIATPTAVGGGCPPALASGAATHLGVPMSISGQPAIRLGADALLKPRAAERSVPAPTQSRLGTWFSASRERHRVNRACRRQQREFEEVLGSCADLPSAQHELQTMWSLRD